MKKIICILLALLMLLSVCACGAEKEEEKEEETVESSVVNPITVMTAQELSDAMGIDFTFLEGYDEADFSLIDGEPAVGNVTFMKDNDFYVYRIAATAEETDISGMYYEWDTQEEAQVDYNTATVCVTEDGKGVIYWFDFVPGIMYSLAMVDNASVEGLTEMANELFVTVQGDSDGDFSAEFTALLPEFQQNYHPGTAGSAISGAKYAAMFADMFVMYGAAADEVTDLVVEFSESLSSDEQAQLTEQMTGVKESFVSLCNDGTDILADSDYTATQAPWDEEAVGACFDAMLSAVK